MNPPKWVAKGLEIDLSRCLTCFPPDWTFQQNAAAFSLKSLEVWVQPDIVAFDDLTIEKAKVKLHRSTGTRDRVQVEGELTLGEDSNGIDPVNEKVVVTVGSTSISIDDGFVAVGSGFEFEGTIGGVDVKMEIEQTDIDTFEFKVKAKGLSITDISNPVEITLRIGDDIGTAPVRLEGKLKLEEDEEEDD